jgi:hypothetical protein
MTDIKQVVDGDTIKTDNDKLRVGFIDTAESVHPDEAKNTAEGKLASEFAQTMLPTGEPIEHVPYGHDHFGRQVSGVVRNVNGVDVDYGFVALDQDMSKYYTKYGTHPDPQKHNEYKQYYSKHVPYQYGDPAADISDEDFNQVAKLQTEFTEAYSKHAKGEASREVLDAATAALYADPAKVAQYRQRLSDWNRPVDQESTSTVRGAMAIAMEDPGMREQYNRVVRNGHLIESQVPEDEPSFWSNLTTTFSMLNTVSNKADIETMWDARLYGSDLDVSEADLVAGVPEQYHSAVLTEASKYNDYAALVYKDQLLEDIKNDRQFSNMEWYAQFGYGAAAIIADPVTLMSGGPLAKIGTTAVGATRTWQASRALAGKGTVAGAEKMASLAAWTAGGAAEGALLNMPRLQGDHTYTAKDYQLDILFDAGFGLMLGSAVGVAKLVLNYVVDVKKARKAEQEEIANWAKERQSGEVVMTPQQAEVKAEAVNAQAPQRVRQALPEVEAPQVAATVTPAEATPFEAVTEVSSEGFKAASDTLAGVIPQDTPLRKLINSQKGLNKKSLSPEERVLANKLNADILHIVASFPDGRIPANVNKAIEGVTFRQKQSRKVNAMSDLLQGKVADETGLLQRYVSALKSHTELWDGTDPIRVEANEFFRNNAELLGTVENFDPDLANLTKSLPKEVSYIKDVVELNQLAAKKNDAQFTELVEELNGLVSERMTQRELGDQPKFRDSSKSFGRTVEMSPQEIMAQLKKEGLTPKTTEYSKRLKELRKTGRVAVSDDINQVGRLDQVEVGKVETDKYSEASVTGIREEIDQDLLPRSFNESVTQAAYKNPTVESLRQLRQSLDQAVLKKLGSKTIRGKSDSVKRRQQFERVRKALITDKQATLARMVKAGEWQNVEDVIRASHDLNLAAKRLKAAQPETTVKPKLTEESMDQAIKDVENGVTPLLETSEGIQDAYEELVEKSLAKVQSGIDKFVASGEKKAFALARKPTGVLDTIGRLAAKITEDLGTKFQNGKLDSLEFIGSRITEIGKGYGGRIRRWATGGIIRDAKYKESVMQIAPQYVRAIDAFAVSKGKGKVGRLMAQQKAGADSKIVDEFNRSVFTLLESKRQGRQVEVHKSVRDFVDQWNRYMDHNHTELVKANIGGFTKERKVENYIPRVWEASKMDAAISKHGIEKVRNLLANAYSGSARRKGALSQDEALKLADRQIEWVKGLDEAPDTDQFLPVADSRAKERLEMDTTTELDGLSIFDLIDTEVMSVGIKYSNRMAGWVGLSKSTDGMITSQLDIDSVKKTIVEEGKDKGVDTSKYEQYYDDLINLMFGRPTRGGLETELRQLKDLTALTRMGGLGTAQVIETGQVITRSVLSTFSSEPVAKKVLKAARKGESERQLLEEIQSISNITDDLEWLDRQSVHLDQAELASTNKARQFSLYMADKVTFGSLKAPASRLLGKTTGYNMIRRAQSRATQASFTIDVAKHFKYGTGKMGNARMADVGLTEVDGTNVELSRVFKDIVEYGDDGLPTKLNVDKWPDEVREQFQYALIRDEAQQIQRTHVGELPPWMNRPLMSLIFQFRQMPIVANNKQLGRSLAFADKEAVMGVLLNSAIAGLVRYGKFAALGTGVAAITGREWKEPDGTQMDTQKYITQFGIFADVSDVVLDSYRAGQTGDWDELSGQVPVLGLMEDYRSVLPVGNERNEQIDAAFGLMPLGNTAYADMVHAAIQDKFGE